MSRQITITQALAELKLYDSRICKAIESASFVAAARTKATTVGQTTKESFNEKAKADLQSIQDLISNRSNIKAAIAQSNAVTYITINDSTMTVAEAIEKKSSVEYSSELLTEMKSQYARASAELLKANNKMETQLADMLKIMAGKDSSLTKEEQETTEATYRANNEYSLVDPLSIADRIKELEGQIDAFLSNVDIALSVSNAMTVIEVE